MDEELENIARSILDIDTLTEQNSDRLDFHEVGVTLLKLALQEAYQAGFRAGVNTGY